MTLFQSLQKRATPQRGQSLVEVALAFPVVLLIFMGVFEVGWALRGYLVLANLNREATRLAVKTGTLDFSDKIPPITSTVGATVRYNAVLSHTLSSLGYSPGLPLNDPLQNPTLSLQLIGGSQNASMIISHLVVDTAQPCDNLAACDCAIDDPNHAQWRPEDDLLLHPETPGFGYYSLRYGLTQTTRISYTQNIEQLKLQNNQLNCTLLKANPSADITFNTDNIVTVEMFYDQPQLLGAPLISNFLTDPIPLYTHTTMRVVTSRDADTTDTIGPVCEVYPIGIPEALLAGAVPNGTPVDVFQTGSGAPNFTWLIWNPAQNTPTYVRDSLLNPRLAINDFFDAAAPTDRFLSTNEVDTVTVAADQDPNSTVDVATPLQTLAGKLIRVPVLNGTTITDIAILEINVVNGSTEIRSTFAGYDEEACLQ